MNTTELLLAFSRLTGTPGREEGVHAFAKKQLEPYGPVTVSPTGSLHCTVREPEEGGIHVLLDAHLDEIGMMVRYIDESGFLAISAAGGLDSRTLLSSLVDVHTKDHGVLTGIVCSTPPHLQKGERENPTVDAIYIDIGLPAEQAKEKVRLGDMITFRSHPTPLLGDRMRGKALDDRAGCVSLLKALEYLDGDIPVGLTVVFSSMEEIGLKGATTSAYAVAPSHAIAVDVSFAQTPDTDKKETGQLGQGPMIAFAPILRHEISSRLVELAEEQNIPYQHEVLSRSTGTNADAIATARTGVRTGLLSIPQRYMHTPNEVVSVADVENTGRLLAAWIADLAKGDA